MKKLTALILCIAITAGALCACGGGEAATNEVRVAYFPNITHAQALYMKDQGIFEKALGDEYSVKWTAFNAGPAEVEALFAGEIDLGYIGPVPAINANVKSHGDVIIIANACDAGAKRFLCRSLAILSICRCWIFFRKTDLNPFRRAALWI